MESCHLLYSVIVALYYIVVDHVSVIFIAFFLQTTERPISDELIRFFSSTQRYNLKYEQVYIYIALNFQRLHKLNNQSVVSFFFVEYETPFE